MRHSVLDGRGARLVAALVFAAATGFLAYYHRDALPGSGAPSISPAEAKYLECRRARFADIDRMMSEGVVDDQRAQLFRGRADALCRTQNPPS